MRVAPWSIRHLRFSGLILMSSAVIALDQPGNRLAGMWVLQIITVIANGDAKARWLGGSYANKRNAKRRLSWSHQSSPMASFDPKRRTDRWAKTVLPSRRLLPPCKRA